MRLFSLSETFIQPRTSLVKFAHSPCTDPPSPDNYTAISTDPRGLADSPIAEEANAEEAIAEEEIGDEGSAAMWMPPLPESQDLTDLLENPGRLDFDVWKLNTLTNDNALCAILCRR